MMPELSALSLIVDSSFSDRASAKRKGERRDTGECSVE
jgi:hypothetical protein